MSLLNALFGLIASIFAVVSVLCFVMGSDRNNPEVENITRSLASGAQALAWVMLVIAAANAIVWYFTL